MDYLKTLGNLSLASRLKRLSDQLNADVSSIYKEMGLALNPRYFPLINLIAKMGPMGSTQAAKYLGVSHPAISKLSQKMIQENYLTKKTDPMDKRSSHLALTKHAKTIIQEASPIWKALQKQLNHLDNLHTTTLLNMVDIFEHNLEKLNLSQAVLHDLNKDNTPVEIVNWQHIYKKHFKRLNMAWLQSEFNGQLTDPDRQAIEQPESYYLARGGYILFANKADETIACIAMKPVSRHHYEISKMAVSAEFQGQGVGRVLLLKMLSKARELNVRTISLETNSKLLRALTLYKNVGFLEKKHPKGKSDYERADIYMELTLHAE